MVIVCGLLFVPTFSVPKFSALGKIPMTGRLSMIETVPDEALGTARSAPPSPFRSAAARNAGNRPTGYPPTGDWKVPSPLPKRSETVPGQYDAGTEQALFVTARSKTP